MLATAVREIAGHSAEVVYQKNGSQVYLLRSSTGARMAAKTIEAPTDAPPDSHPYRAYLSRRSMLIHEIQLLRGLEHPNIVGFRGVTMHRSQPVLLVDWLGDFTLNDYVCPNFRAGRWLQLRWALDLAMALDYLHCLNVVSCDVKPSNIANVKGRAVLFDLGIAHPDAPTPLEPDSCYGTFGYAAPEVLQGDDPTPAADMFAFGITLGEIISGVKHVIEAPHEPDATRSQGAERFVEVPLTFPNGTPAWLEQLVRECVQEDPLQRPSALAAIQTIRPHLP